MKDRSKAKKRLTLNSRDIHAGWIVGAGASVVVCLLATFAVAYRHDVYSSSLGLRDLVSTDVWFRVFLALTCFSLLLFLGLLVYAFLAGRIVGSGDKGEQESIPIAKTTEVKKEAPAGDEKAPATEQQERVIINEARLRTIFDSKFMKSWSGELGKKHIDKVVEDLQFVRDNYRQGAKDNVHFANKHICEITGLLHKMKYFNEFTNSFTDLCCALFECLYIDLPERDNIKKYQEYSDQVKKRFYYLL